MLTVTEYVSNENNLNKIQENIANKKGIPFTPQDETGVIAIRRDPRAHGILYNKIHINIAALQEEIKKIGLLIKTNDDIENLLKYSLLQKVDGKEVEIEDGLRVSIWGINEIELNTSVHFTEQVTLFVMCYNISGGSKSKKKLKGRRTKRRRPIKKRHTKRIRHTKRRRARKSSRTQ